MKPHLNSAAYSILIPCKCFLNCLFLIVLILWTCTAHAQIALWEEHSQAGKQALDTGDFASARKHILAAIEAAKVVGPEDPRLGVSLNDLAQVAQALGDYKEAEKLLEESLSILTRRLGSGHPSAVATLSNLTSLYAEIGRYRDAALLYQQAVKVTVNSLGAQHPNLGIYLNALADIYEWRGEFEEAEALYEEALSILEATLGPRHLRVAVVRSNIAALYSNAA